MESTNTNTTNTLTNVTILTDNSDALKIRRARADSLSREMRNFAVRDFEVRELATEIVLDGYATVFETEYDVFGGPPFGWVESVDAGACDKTLREGADVAFLVNHEGMTLARTKSGTLTLSADNIGLRVQARLEPSDPDVQALAPKMRRRDLDEMSLAFRVMRQEWNDDYTRRHIVEMNLDRGDVSVVNYGANPATSAQLRASDVLSALATMDEGELLAEARSEEFTAQVKRAYEILGHVLTPQEVPDAEDSVRRALARRRLQLI